MSKEENSENVAERKVVTFRLADQMFGIDMASLLEIREWEAPTPLPGVPSYVKGVTNLRGHVVPVVGLAERLGWKPSELHSRSCILVVDILGKHAGFLVDEVADIVSVVESEIQPAPEMETGEEKVIAGLAQVTARGQEAVDPENRRMIMISLLDIEALGLARQLDLAA